jgi:hypothetical protein
VVGEDTGQIAMSFQWLQIRITEEKERRERERVILERLPRALEELRASLGICVDAYNEAFGADSVSLALQEGTLRMIAGGGKIEIVTDESLPGFRVERGSDPLMIQVGVLPGDKLFYRDGDKYLTAEEMTRRILDRTLFPRLVE